MILFFGVCDYVTCIGDVPVGLYHFYRFFFVA